MFREDSSAQTSSFWWHLPHVEFPRPRTECHSSNRDHCSEHSESLAFRATKERLDLLKPTVFALSDPSPGVRI